MSDWVTNWLDPPEDYGEGPEYEGSGLWDDHFQEEVGYYPYAWNDEVTLYQPGTFMPITRTLEEWYDLTLFSKEQAQAAIGMNSIEIANQLSYYPELWGPEEWEEWRDMYEQVAG